MDPFSYLSSDESSHVLSLTGLRGLLIVLPRVSKAIKTEAEAVLANMTVANLAVVPSRPPRSGESLWHCAELINDDVSETILERFGFNHDENSSRRCFEANLRWVLGKLTSVQSVSVKARDFYCPVRYRMIYAPLPAGIFVPVGSTLTTLRIRGKPTWRQIRDVGATWLSWQIRDVGATCPNLAELDWSYESLEFEGFGQYAGLSRTLIDDLTHLHATCPNLKKLPTLDSSFEESPSGKTDLEDVTAFLGMLRGWTGLLHAELLHWTYSKELVEAADKFAAEPGAFTGQLHIRIIDVDYRAFKADRFIYSDECESGQPYFILRNTPRLAVKVESVVF